MRKSAEGFRIRCYTIPPSFDSSTCGNPAQGFSPGARSDLSETARRLRKEKPYATKYEQTSQLFLPSTRPPCVDRLYNEACITPIAVMCTIDRYRTDGLSSSELFMVTPVLGGTRKKRRKLLDIETRK
ncbi:hypothetical protein AVEN_23394-1, partial [Araneus ventricosus]